MGRNSPSPRLAGKRRYCRSPLPAAALRQQGRLLAGLLALALASLITACARSIPPAP